MKGAIGNAFILNMVITFILIFYLLLIGSMAYSKAYKTKNYLLNLVDQYETRGKKLIQSSAFSLSEWDTEANEYLGKIGYPINTNADHIGVHNCPEKENYKDVIASSSGRYDYCIYAKAHNIGIDNKTVSLKYNYLVLVYMKFDVPAIGQYIKVPITGETKTYTIMK